MAHIDHNPEISETKIDNENFFMEMERNPRDLFSEDHVSQYSMKIYVPEQMKNK